MSNETSPGISAFLDQLDMEHHFRYERKYTLVATSKQQALFSIKTHPALFREIFHSRQINNIYFDTPGMFAYLDNKIGISERQKVRIRWYNGTFGDIPKPQLEFKIKQGLVGDKWTFPLPPFQLEKGVDQHFFQHLFQKANLPSPVYQFLRKLEPTLLNTYQRSYFRSVDQRFRLTLDDTMVYYKMGGFYNTFLCKHNAKERYVIEVKYALETDDQADQIGNHFNFRMDKHSKYVNGIDFTWA